MSEGDDLLLFIRRAVTSLQVAPHLQEATVEATARTVVAVLNNPLYLNRLRVVSELRNENVQLRAYIAQIEAFQRRLTVVNPLKPPAKPRKKAVKKTVAKKTVAKNPAVKVKGSTTSNRRSFNQGYRGQ